jgi:hypothetical protein
VKTSALLLLSDELTEFGDGISVAGRNAAGSETLQEGRALGSSRLRFSIFVEPTDEMESLQGISFGKRDGMDLGVFCGAVNRVCVNGVTMNALEAELVVRESVAGRSKVGGPRDVAGTEFVTLVFRREHSGGALTIDCFNGINLCRRERSIHLGEQVVGSTNDRLAAVTALE